MRNAQFLGPLTLLRGAHARGQGMCAMEAAAYLAGEPHSDHPACVSPVLASFLRRLNDLFPDAARQALKPWIPRVLHTRGTETAERMRAWLLIDWSVRDHLPWWLDRAGLHEDATAMRALPAVTDRTSYGRATRTIAAATKHPAAYAAAADIYVAAAAAYFDAAAYAYAAAAILESLPALMERLLVVGQPRERPGPLCLRAEGEYKRVR